MASTRDTMGAVTPTPEWEVQLPEPVGYESPVMEMIYHASDNPADKSRPVFSLAQVLELLRNAGVAGTAPVQPKRYRWDQETDDTFGFMVGPVPDGEWVKWADVAHVFGVRVPETDQPKETK